MKSTDIRQSFLDFFAARDHRIVPSAPLVPHGDATLLFVNAGMVPFKNYFVGAEVPPFPRAVSVQKCLRVSGKHNDLENVGPSPRHHTFFEMLGNFSFGDYFKEEAIRAAWALVTEVWGLDPTHLFATVFEEDDEAEALWAKLSTLPPERIVRCGAKDNFWAMGETGPCGPCSEIMVDLHPERPLVPFHEGADSGRYLEIWNLVFMQFERDGDGALHPLPNPSIDTGAGLERVAAVLQGVEANYDTDLFTPILHAAAELAGTSYGGTSHAGTNHAGTNHGEGGEVTVALRVVADHLRAVAFLLADGVIPGNEGRGYVLRRLLRRAVRHGMRLGLEEPFLHRLLPVLDESFGTAWPELRGTRKASEATVLSEEEKFLSTVAVGAREMQGEIEKARKEGRRDLAGPIAFRLSDTFGLPLEVIREIAEEERFTVDEAGYNAELTRQRERSRATLGEGAKRLAALAEALRGGGEATAFEGYGKTELAGATVVALAGEDGAAVGELGAGREGAVRLDRTVFYAEGGGEVGDTGTLRFDGEGGEGLARVTDTRKDGTGLVIHLIAVERGRLALGTRVDLAVDAERRHAIERNHTATHLLHAALREQLGEGVRQAGSLVAPDRLRFDFTFPHPLSAGEIAALEDQVNGEILRARSTATAHRPIAEALAAGAMALFGEKYGEVVRTVEVPGVSLELCGGCHVANTGAIGLFVITSEKGVASGVRRIEALTGEGARSWVRERQSLLAQVESSLGTEAGRAAEEIERLKRELRERDGELAKLRLAIVSGGVGRGEAGGEVEVEGIRLLAKEVPPAPTHELRNMADALRSKLGSGVVFLGTRGEGKVSLIVAVSEDLVGRVHAGKLVKAAAARVGGSGGGRPDFAQAGGKEADQLPATLAAVPELLREQVGSSG